MIKKFNKINLADKIFYIGLFLVILSFLIFYLVDLRNIFGTRDLLFATKRDYFFFTHRPFFFQHWGRNSGIAELIQWSALAGSALFSAFLAGIKSQKHNKTYKFWLFMSIAFILMMLEDAGNVRHLFMSYIQAIFKEAEQGWAGTGFELLYFSLLGGFPLFIVIRYGSFLKYYKKTKIYMIIGFIFYFLAGSLSFIGTAFSKLIDKNFYTLAGDKFYSLAIYLGDKNIESVWTTWQADNWRFPIGFHLMDSLLEENLEIIGASAFLAACTSFYIYQKRKKG